MADSHQSGLDEFAETSALDLSELTPMERRVVEATIFGDMGVREFQRDEGLASPGTVSKHLSRAREKVPELAELQAGRGR